jgi:hypothetical protein
MTYDNAGNMTLTVDFLWNEGAQAWENSSKSEIGWDASGNRILDAWYNWDETVPDWMLVNKTERAYNAAGDHVMYANYAYNYEWGMLVGTMKITYLRHTAGHILVRNDYMWDLDLSDWYLDGRGFYHYTLYTDIVKTEEGSFDMFPNPVIHVLHIQFPGQSGVSYGICGLDGSMARRGAGYGKEHAIDVADLPKGIYLLRIQQEDIHSGRLFIKN